MSKRVIIFCYDAYGDYLHINGLVNLMLDYYDIIYYVSNNKKHHKYLSTLYRKKRIIIQTINQAKLLLKNNPNNIDIINPCAYYGVSNFFFNSPYKNYYKYSNTLVNKLELKDKSFLDYQIDDKKFPNIILDDKSDVYKNILNIINDDKLNNSDHFYILIGINPKIRIERFDYVRDLKEEENIYQQTINKIKTEKYNLIVNLPNKKINMKYVDKNNPIINLHMLVPIPLHLLLTIEKANEVHLVENSLAVMVYNMQISKLMKPIKINYHKYVRQRCKRLDAMFLEPKLSNWNIID
jgi:hypothetical protein